MTATTHFWQVMEAGTSQRVSLHGPYVDRYPARLPDGRHLVLPLRPLPDGLHAVASLIANQAAFTVTEVLAAHMADLASSMSVDLIVGLPTLGLTFAPRVAELLGHTRYVPLGYSRKFWYEDALSEPVASITSPNGTKRIYLDPNLAPLIARKRVCIVDDAISTGASILAAVRLLKTLDVEVVGSVVAMKQTMRWRAHLDASAPLFAAHTRAVFGCPLFVKSQGDWMPVPGSMPPLP